MPEIPATSKAGLRAAALARRDALDDEARRAADAAIAESAMRLLEPLRFQCLSGFLPIRSECDPRPVMDAALGRGADVALPAFIDRETMVFRSYSPGDPLVAAGFGTREPGAGAAVVAPDVILMPLAAFDRSGTRIGYGKGHYDRAIATMRRAGRDPLLVGLAFSVQEVDRIPAEPHDVRLDRLVTDRGVFDFRGDQS
ncbi:MAG: 5-formyltetrahydrofolate cyclo-ligase [Bauldia sp.]|uniref:5-formyltetrahydrofolate cyclo-ligase n=1 Tax=Bauldia sp. TaxID=2575872 RepID=UPI001E132A8C|nr:5-formyltetrahydrofolate cyclo-ligase [Bauldia sp.]MCB1496133.1 5-formyltetrahydrofolate cyclo-ligase [Bauldia sp.]